MNTLLKFVAKKASMVAFAAMAGVAAWCPVPQWLMESVLSW